MTDIDYDASLGNFVALYPRTRKVFEKYGLDYCCGGKKEIRVAAAEKNIDMTALISELEKAINETQVAEIEKIWINEPLTEIINHITKKHHAFIWEQLPFIDKLLDKVVEIHGAKHGNFLNSINDTYKILRENLEKHLNDEEKLLFPYIKELVASVKKGITYEDANDYKEIMKILYTDHDEAVAALEKIKSLTSNYIPPSDACSSFKMLYDNLQAIEDDLHEYIHLENTILFPRIEKMIM